MIDRAGWLASWLGCRLWQKIYCTAPSARNKTNDINDLVGRGQPPIDTVVGVRIPPHQQEDKGLT